VGTLVDSSVLIAGERGKLDLERMLEQHADESVAIAAITASELLHGVHRAAQPGQRARREAFVEHLLKRLPVVPFDAVAARVHAVTWAELAAKGVNVGAHDLMIAATALAIDWGVATHDARSFPKIPGLTLARW